MTSKNRIIRSSLPARSRAFLRVFVFTAASCLAVAPALADGCFVFKWDKRIDINEPMQKAVILYGAGREDMLLQVKYEGPLQEFGWLVPVPTVPNVERGLMEAFYELSELTQRHFGGGDREGLVTMGMADVEDGGAPVKVIEVSIGGIERAAETIRPLLPLLRSRELKRVLAVENRPAVAQRLGFVVEACGDKLLAKSVRDWLPDGWTPVTLAPAKGKRNNLPLVERWQVLSNSSELKV